MNALPIQVERCSHCHDRRMVWNEMLGKSIPCPQCRRRPRQDASGIKAITAAEKVKMNRLVARAVALEIARAAGSRVAVVNGAYSVDSVYASTNRIMERWAVGHGSGLPRTDEELDELVLAAQEQEDVFSAKPCPPPPLDDGTQTVVDQIVGPNPATRRVDPSNPKAPPVVPLAASPLVIRAFVWQWWCSDVPCVRMAEQRGIRHEDVYNEWRGTLMYLKSRFEQSGHRDLIALLTGQI